MGRWVLAALSELDASSNYSLAALMIDVNTVMGLLTRSLHLEMKRQVDLSPYVQSLLNFLSLQWCSCNGKHLEIRHFLSGFRVC